MRRLDDFLIDRAFQPTADALARYASCYGIAAFLLTGFGLEHLGLAVGSTWLVPLCARAYRLDAQPARNVMPVERVTRLHIRMVDAAIFPIWGLGIILLPLTMTKIDILGWMMVGPAEYFLACRKNPPLERRVPALATQSAGGA